MTAPIAPASEICRKPFRSTIDATGLPVAACSAKTSFAFVPDSSPRATRPIRPASSPASTRAAASGSDLSSASHEPVTQFAAAFGSTPSTAAARTPSNSSVARGSPTSTSAS